MSNFMSEGPGHREIAVTSRLGGSGTTLSCHLSMTIEPRPPKVILQVVHRARLPHMGVAIGDRNPVPTQLALLPPDISCILAAAHGFGL